MPTSQRVDSDQMRGHNEGSGPTRRKDGRWQVAVTMPNGRRVYDYAPKTASRDEARARLTALLARRDEQLDMTADSPLGKYLLRWLDDVAPSLRPATVRHYRLVVSLHLVPALGHHKLRRLTPAAVQAYLAAASATHAPQTVRHHRAVLRRALNTAMRWGLVTRNVATLVDAPRVPRAELRILDPAEVRQLLATSTDDRLHPLWVLAATTGMRQGELLGLTWANVDYNAGTVTVARSLTRAGGSWELTEPKTALSRRTIHVPAMAAAALRGLWARQQQERLAAGYGGKFEGLVFTTPKGMPLVYWTVLAEFHRALERAGLPKVRFHDLRHGAATMLLAAGYTLEDVKHLLGHSTITLTSNTYGHYVAARSRTVADGIAKLIEEPA